MERFPVVTADALAWITEADMIEVDRIMIDDLRIELIQMMENAGRRLAELIRTLAAPERVLVAAGSGGNGGGGLVAARHLANAGIDVRVVTTRAAHEMAPVPAHQLDILERMGVPRLGPADAVDAFAAIGDRDVLVDAVIGYSLRGAPSGAGADLIGHVNASSAFVVSLDTPSGLDVTAGGSPGVIVDADVTMTLALPKVGLRHAAAVGDLYVADISVPPAVASIGGKAAPPFGPAGLVRVSR